MDHDYGKPTGKEEVIGDVKEEEFYYYYQKYKFLSIKDDAGLTVIHHAAEEGNTVAIHYLVLLGQDINVKDNEDRTPLHWAAYSGHVDTCRYLLNRSNSLANPKDINGATPLHWAVIKSHYPVVQLFIEFNIPLFVKDNHGSTPYDIALRHQFQYEFFFSNIFKFFFFL